MTLQEAKQQALAMREAGTQFTPEGLVMWLDQMEESSKDKVDLNDRGVRENIAGYIGDRMGRSRNIIDVDEAEFALDNDNRIYLEHVPFDESEVESAVVDALQSYIQDVENGMPPAI